MTDQAQAYMIQHPGVSYDDAQRIVSQYGGGSSGGSSEPMAFMFGSHVDEKFGVKGGGGPEGDQVSTGKLTHSAGSEPTTMTKSDSEAWLLRQMDQNTKAWQDIQKDMHLAGLPADAGIPQMLNMWDNYWAASAASTMAGQPGKVFSPMDLLARDASGSADANGRGTQTRTSTSTRVINPKDLEAQYQGVSGQALGRRATPGEAAAAASAVGGMVSKNPTRVTSTAVTKGANTTESSVTHEGSDSQAAIDDALLQQAMQSKEYGAYQAAGHYFPLLVSALGALNNAGA